MIRPAIVSIALLARGAVAQSDPTLVELNYHYDPSKVAAGIFGTLYTIVALILFYRVFTSRAWWGLCLPIGAGSMASGFWLRIIMTIHPNSLALYLAQLLILLLSPAAFLAFDYILYGRFIVNCVERRHSLIRPERTSVYFVISDISTFLIQGFGGALLSSSNSSTEKTGAYVVVGGLALQTISFAFFMFLVYYAYRSLERDGMKPFKQPWGMILKVLSFTATFFMLRCIYRTLEFGQGLGQGYLITHEVFFYVFDALPLLIGISVYILYWPTKYLKRSPVADMIDIYHGYDSSTAELMAA